MSTTTASTPPAPAEAGACGRSSPAQGSAGSFFTEVRRERIDFRAVATEAGCTRGTLCHSPAWGWGVRPADGKPADFCTITPPAMREGETEIRLSADERHWVFMGWVSPEPNMEVTHTAPGSRPLDASQPVGTHRPCCVERPVRTARL